MKTKLLERPVLASPHFQGTYTMYSQALDNHVGCVPLQNRSNGISRPIKCWYQSLNHFEYACNKIHPECLALAWVVCSCSGPTCRFFRSPSRHFTTQMNCSLIWKTLQESGHLGYYIYRNWNSTSSTTQQIRIKQQTYSSGWRLPKTIRHKSMARY